MIQGIASGKEFDEIHVDISNELVQIASTALTEIKKQIPLSDGMEKLITASLLSDSASAQSAINTYAEGIYDGFSNRLGGLVNLYRILTSQFMILFIALLYIGYGHCLHSHNSPDRCEIQLSHNFCTIWYSLLLFSKCRRKYARCKAQQPLFRQNSIP